MNTREREVMMEHMLAECVPGGSSCDPQRVADAIHEWFATHDALLSEGSNEAPFDNAAYVRMQRIVKTLYAEQVKQLHRYDRADAQVKKGQP